MKDNLFYDIHSHILPGIDDGAKNIEASLEMLYIAAKNGTQCIFATSHYLQGSIESSAEIMLDECEKLRATALYVGLGNIQILCGAELYICPELPELVKDNKVCTLNGTSYVLIELPMNEIPVYAEEVFYRLQLYGYIPIIAHPERNACIIENPGILHNFIKSGALAQINASSINGIYGKIIKKLAINLISHNLVHFVASDSHTCGGRSPKLNTTYDEIVRKFGRVTARRLFISNGKAVAENMAIHAHEPKEIKRRFFFGLIPYYR